MIDFTMNTAYQMGAYKAIADRTVFIGPVYDDVELINLEFFYSSEVSHLKCPLLC